VTPAPLTITANDASRVYGVANPAFSVSYSGFVLSDGPSSLGGTLSFSTPATPSSPVGSYSITPSGLTSTHYGIAFVNGTLTVNKRTTSTAASLAATPINEGGSTTATVTVSDASGAALVDVTPTGTVSLTVSNGTISVPVSVTLSGSTGTFT